MNAFPGHKEKSDQHEIGYMAEIIKLLAVWAIDT